MYMSEVSITVTPDQKERLSTIVATHLDLNIQPALDKAIADKNEAQITDLIKIKEYDKEILSKIWSAR